MKLWQLVNLVVVIVAAFGMAAWSVVAFGEDVSEFADNWEMTEGLVFDQSFVATDVSIARLNGRDAVVVFPNSEVEISWDEDTRIVDLNLTSGSVIFATDADDFSVSVNSSYAKVESQNSIAYVSLTEDSMEVYALNHPSLVTFKYLGEDLNSISVPTEYRMNVPESKISDTIGLLRLTKLSKEFPIYKLDEEDMTEEIDAQYKAIQDVYAEASVNFLAKLQVDSDFGPPLEGFGNSLNGVLEGVRDVLTLTDYAEESLEDERKENWLLYAMTNLLYGDSKDGDFWLDMWTALEHDAEDVQDLNASLFFVLPGDELYDVKAATADVVYVGDDIITSLKRRYQEIESLLAEGSQVNAEEAYLAYQIEFENALNSGVFDEEEWLDDISREYILLELLLRSNSIFYTVDTVALLNELEDKIFALAGSDQDLDEERLAFVQSKIRFLTNLFDFVVDRKLDPEEATDLAEELVSQAETYMNSLASKVAVQEYFENQLKDFDLAIQFMNSPEFYSYSDFEVGLESYRKKVDDLEDLQEYIQNLRDGSVSDDETILEADAITEVGEAMTLNGVQYSDIVALEDLTYRLFEITGARTGGYPFEANYDRETGILYDVVIGEVRFSTGLLLENIMKVVEETMTEDEEVVDEVEEVVEDDKNTLSENLAESEAELNFVDVGLEDFTITVVDVDANLFTFEGMITQVALPVSGTYDMTTGRVSEIVWEFNSQSMSLPDLDLAALEGAIEATYSALIQ